MEAVKQAGTACSRPARGPLAAAMLVALLAPGMVLAQTAKELELEARVAELERRVEQLLATQQPPAAPAAPAAAPGAPAPAASSPIQLTTITPQSNPGTTFTVGGHIRTDAMTTHTSDGAIAKNTPGRDVYLPGVIPVGGAEGDTYFDSHLKFSRIWVDASTVLDSGDRLQANLEWDFFGGSLGNTAATNTYGATLRHAYVRWNDLLIGQTWTNFMDTGALLDSVDFIGPTDGLLFARQAQIRYTHGPWVVSLENPETTVQPYGGGARLITGSNTVPDLVVRYTNRGDWGHFSAAGLVRQLSHDTVTGSSSTDTGFAATISGRYNITERTDIRYQLTGGEGFGRYVGLAAANQDAMVAADGSIDALGGWAGYVGLRHVLNPRLRTNLYYARSDWDNDTALTGFDVTRTVQSWHANLLWSPVPKLDLGIEAIWGERTLESGTDGELIRLHTMARYTF